MLKLSHNLAFVTLSLFFLLPIFASADTVANSAITSDTTWSPQGGVYIIDNGFMIETGATLTIEAGTIVKAKPTYGPLGSSVYGKLVVNGTATSPVYFTSINDDSVGGDTGLDGPTSGNPGDWRGLFFLSGSTGEFDHTVLRYAGLGGWSLGLPVGIKSQDATLTIKNSHIYDNTVQLFDWSVGYYRVGTGVYNIGGSLTIENSTIENHLNGVFSESGPISIRDSLIKNNFGSGVALNGLGAISMIGNNFMNNKTTGHIDPNMIFTHSSNQSTDQEKGFDMSGVINQDITLHSDDLPILIKNGALYVYEGHTLTLSPGSVVKIGGTGPGSISVFGGKLIAHGTKEKPIYFTSTKDDTLFGDTNGDGTTTTPTPRDWNSLYFEEGSTVSFDHVVVRYGGYNFNGEYLAGVWTAVYDRGADFDIKNSLFEKNYGAAIYKDAGTLDIERSEFTGPHYGIFSRGGTINVHNSSFHGHQSDAILNQSGQYVNPWYQTRPFELIDARNNWWGAPDGPRNIATTTPSGSGDPIGNDVLYEPFLTGDPLLAQGPDPVIIIPGIVGSELYNGSDLIWPNLFEMGKDINDQFITENLNLDDSGNSIKTITVSGAIKQILNVPILNVNIFKDLEIDFTSNNYVEDDNLFYFPYDWRLDLDDTKELLKQKIEEVKEETGKGKVNIIAHSMGGLLTKAYIKAYGEGSVDKLIFVGTPHLGAPKAGKVILEGDRLSIPWLEEDRIKELAHNSPALHELLPNETYFNEFQGYLKEYQLYGDTGIKNYDQTNDYFIDKRAANPTMFDLTKSFDDQELEDFSPTTIDTYNITGCKTSTQAAYAFAPAQSIISQVGYTSGDGTVPMVSANYLNIPGNKKYYVKGGEHAALPSTNGVRELILGILAGEVSSLESNVSNSSDFCNFKGTKLTWHSPIEIHIYDSQGRHTGPTADNAIEYGVPGIDYDISEHNKFIFLPTDNGESYRVVGVGLEEGSFDLLVTETEDGIELETKVFNDVAIIGGSEINFEIEANQPINTLTVKTDGETRTEAIDATLLGEAALDLIPPTTEVLLTGKEYKDGEYKKEVEVSFTSSDQGAGVLETWYSLDNGVNYRQYTGPFILGIEGVYNVKYYSVDRAGNNESPKQVEVIIGKLNKYLRKLE